jgi:D-3-phosphoglycerate dehydrogenase
VHHDVPGIIGAVGTIFGKHGVNIAQMSVGRRSDTPGGEAIGVLNLDGPPPQQAIDEVTVVHGLLSVRIFALPVAGRLPAWLQ